MLPIRGHVLIFADERVQVTRFQTQVVLGNEYLVRLFPKGVRIDSHNVSTQQVIFFGVVANRLGFQTDNLQ